MSLGGVVRAPFRPLPALVSSLGAVGLTKLYLDNDWIGAVLAVMVASAFVVMLYVIGSRRLRNHPHSAALLMESGLLLLVIGSAVAGALLIGIAIKFTPAPNAPGAAQAIFAALFAAIASYLGSLVINPKDTGWNPVKDAIKTSFANAFTGRRDATERDAHDAVHKNEGYSSLAESNEHVGGWDWDDRRLRSVHLQRAIDRGYLVDAAQNSPRSGGLAQTANDTPISQS